MFLSIRCRFCVSFDRKQIKGAAMRKILVVSLFLCFCSTTFGQSVVSIDKLDKKDIAKSKVEVGFSALIEGTVGDSSQLVYAMVYQPHLKAWRLFPAVVYDEGGVHRWRALCHFGKPDGTGAGDEYPVKAVAFSKDTIAKSGMPQKLSSEVLKSDTVVLKRAK